MPVINIQIRRKKATSPVGRIVCGNSDYKIAFNFDEEWGAYEAKTARFIWNGQYVDVVFSGTVCDVPVITNATMCAVGVYAGDLSTTTPALIGCDKSILCSGGLPADPTPEVYAQIMELLNSDTYASNVKYVAQELTEEQQAQARVNIGVDGVGQVNLKKYGITKGDIDHKAPYSAEEWEQAYNNYEGIKAALVEMAANGHTDITLPQGTYVVCYQNPTGTSVFSANTGWEIVIPSHVNFDLNGSTIRVIFDSDNRNPYDASSNNVYALNGTVFMFSQSYHSAIRNGTLLGDRYERSFSVTAEKNQDQTYGIKMTKGSEYCEISNMTIAGFMGDSVTSDASHDPDKGSAAVMDTVFTAIDLTSEGVETAAGADYIFTSPYQDLEPITSAGGTVMTLRTNIGYTYEFGSYGDAFVLYFYDENYDFLSKKRYEQCDNIPIPAGARYCRIRIIKMNSAGEESVTMVYQLTPPSPQFLTVRDCKIYDNNRGGMSNLPHDTLVEHCEIFNCGTAGSQGFPVFGDSTRYIINCEDLVTRKIVIRNSYLHDGFHGILMSAKFCLVDGVTFKNLNTSVAVYRGRKTLVNNCSLESTRMAAFSDTISNTENRFIANRDCFVYGWIGQGMNIIDAKDGVTYENNVITPESVYITGSTTDPISLGLITETPGAWGNFSESGVKRNITGKFKDTTIVMQKKQYSTAFDEFNIQEGSKNVVIEYRGEATTRRFVPITLYGTEIIRGLVNLTSAVDATIDGCLLIPQDRWQSNFYNKNDMVQSYRFKDTEIVIDDEFTHASQFMNFGDNASNSGGTKEVSVSFENCKINITKAITAFSLIRCSHGYTVPKLTISFKNCTLTNTSSGTVAVTEIVNFDTRYTADNYTLVWEDNELVGNWTEPQALAE